MPILTIYHPGGKVTIKPTGYPGEKCYEATRPYDEARTGERVLLEGEAEVSTPVVVPQQQKLGGS